VHHEDSHPHFPARYLHTRVWGTGHFSEAVIPHSCRPTAPRPAEGTCRRSGDCVFAAPTSIPAEPGAVLPGCARSPCHGRRPTPGGSTRSADASLPPPPSRWFDPAGCRQTHDERWAIPPSSPPPPERPRFDTTALTARSLLSPGRRTSTAASSDGLGKHRRRTLPAREPAQLSRFPLTWQSLRRRKQKR